MDGGIRVSPDIDQLQSDDDVLDTLRPDSIQSHAAAGLAKGDRSLCHPPKVMG